MSLYEENLKIIRKHFPKLKDKILYSETDDGKLLIYEFLKKYNLIHINWKTIPFDCTEDYTSSRVNSVDLNGTIYVHTVDLSNLSDICININDLKKYIKTIVYPDE